MKNGIYEQIAPHLKIELKLIGLEATDELQVNTVTQQAMQENPEKPKPSCHHCKKPGHDKNQCIQLKLEKDEAQNNTNSASNNNNNNNGGQTNSNSNNHNPHNTNANNTKNWNDRKPGPVYPTCETFGRTRHSTEKSYFGANATNSSLHRNRLPEGESQFQQTHP